jgi:uncharacterized RDD family membrane protein YckC
VIESSSAGFGRRLAALIYDSVLVASLLIIYTFGALLFTGGHAILRDTAGDWYFVYCAGEITVIAGYFVVNWVRSGQTLGMRAWRLRAVNDAGKPLNLASAALRSVCGFLAWAPAALGVLWLYLDSEHLALHDRLSRTRVLLLARSRNRHESTESDDGGG